MAKKKSKSRSVSLRDVAKAAGVSPMTASRAFRKDVSIKASSREKVLQAAARLNYRPDRLLTEVMSSFVQRRTMGYRETLAAVWWPERWEARNAPAPYARDIYEGLEAGAERHGCHIEHHVIETTTSAATLDRMFFARGIQGVLVTPPPRSGMQLSLEWKRISSVIIGSSLTEPQLHRTEPSHFNSFLNALHHVHAHGYRRPCLLVQTDLEERMRRAYTAAFLAWENQGEKRILHSRRPGRPELETWIRKSRADAIMVDTRDWLEAIPESCRDLGFTTMNVNSPDDPVAGIYQNTRNIAQNAVDLLMQVRIRNETGIPEDPKILLSTGKWVDGCSIRGLKHLPHEIWPG